MRVRACTSACPPRTGIIIWSLFFAISFSVSDAVSPSFRRVFSVHVYLLIYNTNRYIHTPCISRRVSPCRVFSRPIAEFSDEVISIVILFIIHTQWKTVTFRAWDTPYYNLQKKMISRGMFIIPLKRILYYNFYVIFQHLFLKMHNATIKRVI